MVAAKKQVSNKMNYGYTWDLNGVFVSDNSAKS